MVLMSMECLYSRLVYSSILLPIYVHREAKRQIILERPMFPKGANMLNNKS